ncbi:MAG: hypothetical protein ACE5NA_09460 [Nitrospiraceae bacterium]
MSTESDGDMLQYAYQFRFEDGSEKHFETRLNAKTLELQTQKPAFKPEWTKLKYHQCQNCPLGDDVEYCPVAVNLSNLVESFKDSTSYEHTQVRVEAPERTYEQHTTLQDGLSSIIGMHMVTSNCPIMDQLRPMVRFHLPFATNEETMYRAVCMYLTKQYFVMRGGGTPDWELSKLTDIYQAVSIVNAGMADRLRHASTKDANVNALVILSAFVGSVDCSLKNGLNKIQYLFSG